MPGHSRSKNGVASLAYVPGIHVLATKKDVDGRTSPAMTRLRLTIRDCRGRLAATVRSQRRRWQAPLRHLATSAKQSLSEGKQTWRGGCQIDAIDPTETCASQDFCDAKMSARPFRRPAFSALLP